MSTSTLRPERADAVQNAFDFDGAWQLNEQVSIRPERFGALLYHFGTRRLSFLKDVTLVEITRSLVSQPSARAACLAAGVAPGDLGQYERALATLAASSTISERSPS
ncbi:putative mycofactocin binding protein MftB [Jatrophihabitans sp. GAS493]|uniref:mycofactocin biosynthesis chaperone MftB n=1 Tax=Jatrophihabitans sp. GAS493 TaxID=1907575 RepID=UPI000BBFDF7D|nr:mycofactocin biosynthesis chaperone MftB [Jatrophihabitans sp. GAS493]SOD72174.1 putative mycofactocin binding protein MftB [Jatrophihabitans sp. GAS493]